MTTQMAARQAAFSEHATQAAEEIAAITGCGYVQALAARIQCHIDAAIAAAFEEAAKIAEAEAKFSQDNFTGDVHFAGLNRVTAAKRIAAAIRQRAGEVRTQ